MMLQGMVHCGLVGLWAKMVTVRTRRQLHLSNPYTACSKGDTVKHT